MSSKLFKKVDSSDYIRYKKQIAISAEYSKANTPEDLNPIKMNGAKYNKNFEFLPTTTTTPTDASNCLVNSKSYELERNYKNGLKYMKIICE